MKIELKNIKHAEFASEETDCFEASLYIDGVRCGKVSNDGHGGCHCYSDHGAVARINAYAETLPPLKCSFTDDKGDPVMLEQDADLIISHLVSDWLAKRDLKRKCAKQTLFRIPGEAYEEGSYHVLKAKFTPAVKVHLVGKYGANVMIVNETL